MMYQIPFAPALNSSIKSFLSEFYRGQASLVIDMFKLQLLVLFAFRMKVYTAHGPRNLIETYIIEAFKTSPKDFPNPMIRH